MMQLSIFNYMVYQYKVMNSKGYLEEYSKEYNTLCEAVAWYNTGGRWLEENCQRELVLTTKYN